MSQAATVVTTVITSPTSLTTMENLFSIVHQFFDDYRTAIFILTGTLMTACLFNKLWVNRKYFSSTQSMRGKTVLITGGNAGIGYEAAKDLLVRGARVVILCRNMDKGRQAVRQLLAETGCDEENLRLMECDLCSLDSVRRAAQLYNDEEDRLDVLICNAGVAWASDLVTKDGFNTVIEANYLGHFLLTNLLLDKLKQCRPSRIINVSSGAHKALRSIDWTDAFTRFKSSRIWGTYAASKAFQILSTYKLKKHLLAKEGINTFSLHPGWVWTSIQAPMKEAIGFYAFLVFYPMLYLAKMGLAKTPITGAQTTIYCAVEPALERSSELYFENCAPAKVTFLCKDDEIADKLWKNSLEAVGLEKSPLPEI